MTYIMFKKNIFIVLLFVSFSVSAQDDDGDPGGFGDGDPATDPFETPINGVDIPLIITGVVVAILLIKNKQKAITC